MGKTGLILETAGEIGRGGADYLQAASEMGRYYESFSWDERVKKWYSELVAGGWGKIRGWRD